MTQKSLKEYLESTEKTETVAQDEDIGFIKIVRKENVHAVIDVDAAIKSIISGLVGVEMIAKDLHYNASGKSFYGIHLLADLVWDVRRERDELNEVYYLGEKNTLPPLSHKVFAEAVDDVYRLYGDMEVTGEDFIDKLRAHCRTVVNIIENIKKDSTVGLCAGVHAILDEISKKLLTAEGLLNRTLSGAKKDDKSE